MTHSSMTRHIRIWYDSFIRDTTHSYVTCIVHTWHDSFTYDTTLSICDMTLFRIWFDSFICKDTYFYVIWLFHLCVFPSCACLVSVKQKAQFAQDCLLTRDRTYTSVTWLKCHDLCVNDMTHSFVTWLIHTWHFSLHPKCVKSLLEPVYGVATISRLLKISGLFCKRAL